MYQVGKIVSASISHFTNTQYSQVCPHAGGVGLCEYVVHLSMIDFISIAPTFDRNVVEWVDHLHEHFKYPVSVNSHGRYNAPLDESCGYRWVVLDSHC